MQAGLQNNDKQVKGSSKRLVLIVVTHLVIVATFFTVTFIWGSFG